MAPRMTPILAIVFLDAIGMGIIIPVLPGLITDLTGRAASDAVLWGGLLTGAYAAMLFLCAPLIGALSDRFGRRPVLIAALLAMVVDYLLLSVAGTIGLLLLGRLIAGITGASYAVATACAADMTLAQDRPRAFGMIGAAFALGLVLGPALGGVAAGYGLRAPFVLAAGLSATALLGVLVLLPEMLSKANRRPFDWRRSNPLGALAMLRDRPALIRPALLILLLSIAHQVYPSVWAWFTTVQFGMSVALIGLSITAFGLCMALVQGLLVRAATNRIGEAATVRAGLAVNVLVLAIIPFVTTEAIFFVLIPAMAIGFIVGPILQGMMSRVVGADAQGALMGVMSSIAAIAMMIGPLAMTAIFYAATIPHSHLHLPGAPFILASFLTALCLVVLRPCDKRIRHQEALTPNPPALVAK